MEEAMKNARFGICPALIYINLIIHSERVPPTEYGKHCHGTCVEGRLVMMSDAFPYAFAARLGQK